MAETIDLLVQALNAGDVDAAAALFARDYRSSQPAHPGRTFTGRDQLRANWTAMFAGVPDFHADVVGSAHDGTGTWTEWHWSGTTRDGRPFAMRGVTIFEIADGNIVTGRLYVEPVESDAMDVEDAVASLSGERPHQLRDG